MKYFEIEGIIEISNVYDLDTVTDLILKAVEEKGAFFGGGIKEVDEEGDEVSTKKLIENNNGWIENNNQDDLPKTYTECHFELNNNDIQIGAYVYHKNIFVGIDEQYFPSEVKAYIPIEKPQPRI